MRRIRLSTLLLLGVIAALVTALVVQHDRASRRIAELEGADTATLKIWKMVAVKPSAEMQVKGLTKGVTELKSGEGKDR
jgi:hypothetical protein